MGSSQLSVNEAVPARIQSIDLLRLVAAFAVVFIHSHPNVSQRDPGYLIFDQAAGFAVPFFFIVSGYLFTLKIQRSEFPGKVWRSYILRLTILYAAWSLISIVVIYEFFQYFDLWKQIGPNATSHLWFFPALAIGLSLLYPFLKFNAGPRFFYIAVPLYVFGLLAGAYALTPVGFYTEFNTRNGPFFSALFVGIGMLIALKNYHPSLKLAVIVLLAGMTLHLGEAYVIVNNYWPLVGKRADYFIGTLPYATGVMFLALALRDRFQNSFITTMAKLTLGVYAIQGIAIIAIMNAGLTLSLPLWPLVYPVEIFILSLLLAFMISKVPGVRRIVS